MEEGDMAILLTAEQMRYAKVCFNVITWGFRASSPAGVNALKRTAAANRPSASGNLPERALWASCGSIFLSPACPISDDMNTGSLLERQ